MVKIHRDKEDSANKVKMYNMKLVLLQQVPQLVGHLILWVMLTQYRFWLLSLYR